MAKVYTLILIIINIFLFFAFKSKELFFNGKNIDFDNPFKCFLYHLLTF